MRAVRDGGKIAGARMNLIRLLPWSEWEFPIRTAGKEGQAFSVIRH
jgi:hypothetical protein